MTRLTADLMTGPQEGKIYVLLRQVPDDVAAKAYPWFERNKATLTKAQASDVIDRLKRHVAAAARSNNHYQDHADRGTITREQADRYTRNERRSHRLDWPATGTKGTVRGRDGFWHFEGPHPRRPGYVQVTQDVGDYANGITVPAEDFEVHAGIERFHPTTPNAIARVINDQANDIRRAAWIEWRKLAAELVELGSTHGEDTQTARFAIPSRTGNNDLDFWAIVRRDTPQGRRFYLNRVIGGRPDTGTRMRPETMVEIARSIMVNPREAMTRYGRELEHCGRCGRHLTDEDSRARGYGSDCWSKL